MKYEADRLLDFCARKKEIGFNLNLLRAVCALHQSSFGSASRKVSGCVERIRGTTRPRIRSMSCGGGTGDPETFMICASCLRRPRRKSIPGLAVQKPTCLNMLSAWALSARTQACSL
jgi:hypothetical protein